MKNIRRIRTTEKELLAPSLITLLKLADKANNVSSKEFKESLYKLVYSRLTKKDKEMLPSRSVSRINQTIMNLVSHRTLDKLGIANYNPRHGTFKVKAKAREMMLDILSKNL